MRPATESEYTRALQRIKLTAMRKKMLRVHMNAPGGSITCRALSRRMGWKYPAANLHYGILATQLCKQLKRWPEVMPGERKAYSVQVMMEFGERGNEVLWIMQDNFAAALRKIV